MAPTTGLVMQGLVSVSVDRESQEDIVINVFLFTTPFQWKDVRSVTVIQSDQQLLSVMREDSVLVNQTSREEDVKDVERTNRINWQDVLIALFATT